MSAASKGLILEFEIENSGSKIWTKGFPMGEMFIFGIFTIFKLVKKKKNKH